MLFEMWLKSKGYDQKKLSKEQGRALFKEFGEEMVPVVRDCTNFLNAALKDAENRRAKEK